MNYTQKFPLLDRLAPDAQTRAGVAWRLYWLWPEMRLMYLFALLAWGAAACSAGRFFQTDAYMGKLDFVPKALAVFLPLLYVELFRGSPNGGYTVGCGRALAVLPVQRARMRDAAWFIDVPSSALDCLAMTWLVALILPLPNQYRVWCLAAVATGSLLYAGGRAAISVYRCLSLGAEPELWLPLAARKIEVAMVAVYFVLFITMLLAAKSPASTSLVVVGSIMILALSFLRHPEMASARAGGAASGRKSPPAFSNRAQEIFRIIATPILIITCILAGLTVFIRLIVPEGTGSFPYVPAIIFSGIVGQMAATRVRAIRVLPLSTRTLTLAAALLGLCSAMPMVFLVLLRSVDIASDATLMLSIAAATTALVIGSMWIPFYQQLFALAVFVVLMSSNVIREWIRSSGIDISTAEAMLLWTALAVLLLAISTQSIHRLFWWDSKVYRHQFKQRQRQVGSVNLSYASEGYVLALAFLTAIAGGIGTLIFIVAD